ncbi:hypothetical protein RJ55_05487 [Drechmeria coniospora]|nr:hypothetical protein RJ55_05487 [Drechmeria coniospora]
MPLQAGGEDGNQPTADVLIASGSTTGGPTTSAQHSSSMSFARTVSHEISFADDDDAEWNLQRTQVDPSSRVPPSDQTRPNPVASPPVANLGERKEQPPMPTKTLEILDETKRKAEHGTDRNMTSGTQQVEPEVTPALVGLGLDTCQSLSREMQYSQAQVSEVRDEEGLHLIPRSDIAETAGQSNRVSSLDASFTKDDNDDDFFSQIQTPGTHADISVNPPLEQTSTLPPSSSFSKPPLEEKAGNFEAPRIADTGLAVADAAGSQTNNEPPTEDIATKWEEAFAGDGDDDDFLVDDAAAEPKEFDPSAFLGSDDEGLLEDDTDAMPQPVPVVSPRQPVDPKRYVPASPSPQVASTFITPAALAAQSPYQQPALPPFSPPTQYSQPAAPQPEPAKAQSFADKSKGGYSSPYDLPTELMPNLVRPRKRSSLSQQSQGQTPPPPISAATFPVGRSPSAGPPPAAVRPAGQPSLNQKSSAPALRGHSSFFEDLPMAAKPRPASRQSNPAQLPSQYVPTAQQPPSLPPPRDFAPPPPPASLPSQPPAAVPVANLVAPERASPYAALQSSMVPLPPPPAQASRYSPALASPQHAPPTSASRYSPAPPSSRSGSLYSPNTITPHLPRTSSPLAHIEPGGDKPHGATHPPNGEMQRRSSASFEPRLTRVPSLPPTREVDEEEERDDESLTRRSFGTTHPTAPLNIPPKFRPLSPLAAQQSPPLPSNNFAQSALSPPKRAISYYAPQIPPATQPGFVPPARASTQSPSTMHSSRQYRPTEAGPRPSSAHSSAHSSAAPVPPRMPQQYYAPAARPRGQSLTMDMVPPTDGREQDPLERWKGAPLFAWGVGGTVVTTFPKSIPRYAMNHSTPTMVRAPGEVKLHHIKDIEPLQDRLAKFPGPLRGKSKKKEALTWLATAIDAQEKDVPDISFHPQLSLEAKRGIERLLLWKLLRIFVEFDGTLEGFAAVEKAVRDVLQPGTVTTPAADPDAMFPNAAGFAAQAGPTPAMQADGIDAGVMEGIRHSLLKGNGEAAVWSAVDKRLWGHAMLISHTISPELYKRVAQEFVRKEVNYPGCSNESIGAFYKVLSGNYDDCVDELVPVHARAGLQLVSKESTSGPATDAIGGLDKWRETLTLILSNRSPDDVRGLNALGKLLSSYGRAEASQICFMFSRNLSVFGGLEDPNVDFVLLGSDHRTQADQFSKETEALQLSEVYEYGLSLGPGSATAAGAPHLAAYKLQHAVTLAEFGYRDKALQYCDAITSAIASQTRRSPYHHIVLEAAVEDFTTRLKQAPKEISSSWMSKPSMNKVSDSVWNRFNKFVAGDEGENGGNGLAGDASGPFARVTSSPNLSRSPSTSNFEMFGAATSGYAASAAPLSSAAASKYAPVATPASGSANPYASSAAQQLPTRTSAGRQSNEYAPNPYEPGYPGTSPSLPHSNSYAPTGHAAQRSSHVLARSESTPLMRSPPTDFAKPPPAGHRPSGLQESPSIYAQLGQAQDNASTSMYGYQPSAFESKPLAIVSPVEEDSGQPEEPESGEYKPPSSQTYGYEPPSSQTYGYEPPSYQPDLESEGEDDDEAPKPKKKSFMDDDEDDIPALKEQGKSKSDKDKENEEMFRKAAEEDAKRAAAQQANKKGWGFSSWFGAKKENANIGEAPSNKPIRAKLGETSSFVYDPDLKRWINKKPGAENTEAKKSTPPPPKAKSRSASGTPAPDSSMPPPPASGRMSVPPPTGPPRLTHTPAPESSQESLGPPPLSRSVSTPGLLAAGPTPPSRPATSMSNASSIDDLLGPPGARKPGQKKPRKSGRYVDVMAK